MRFPTAIGSIKSEVMIYVLDVSSVLIYPLRVCKKHAPVGYNLDNQQSSVWTLASKLTSSDRASNTVTETTNKRSAACIRPMHGICKLAMEETSEDYTV